MKILLMAGEVSGDYQAAYLARALLERQPNLQLFGTGGQHMRQAGVKIHHELAHLSSVGLLEPIRHLWPLQRIYRDISRLARQEQPDLAVLIDNQGFNLAVGRILHRLQVPVLFYFPPQIWVGGFFFARSLARMSRLVISAFPREAEIYRNSYGANAISYGHPLLDIVQIPTDSTAILKQAGLDPARPLVGLMPGSRYQEIKELGPAMLEAARLLHQHNPRLQFVLPIAGEHVRGQLMAMVQKAGLAGIITPIQEQCYGVLGQAEVVLTCSGTATLELTLLGVPMVVAYRLDPMSHWLARRLSMTPYVAMPNVLMESWVVPEIIQYRITGEHFATHARNLLDNPDKAALMRRQLAAVRAHLGDPGALARTADRILTEASVAFSSPERAPEQS